jgi:hypothetical protein
LDEACGKVRELRLSKTLVWIGMATPFALIALLVLALVVLSGTHGGRAIQYSAISAPPLTQKLSKQVLNIQKPVKDTPCGAGMLLVEGDFCPKVAQKCLQQSDPEGSMLRSLRCAEYEQPARCASQQRVRMKYCIDKTEYMSEGSKRATSGQTLSQAQAACQSQGKRLCSNEEWTFACEGEAMQPYPYGFKRDQQRCNIDRIDLVDGAGKLKDLRASPGSYPECKSSFGVLNLSGNVEEYVMNSRGSAQRKGGYWQPGANHCRAAEPHEDPGYAAIETGFRCCSDAP